MKLHGKRDFYDSVVQFGADPTLHYNRESKDVDPDLLLQFIPDWRNTRLYSARTGLEARFFLIGFCGTVYPGAQVLRSPFKYVYGQDELLALQGDLNNWFWPGRRLSKWRKEQIEGMRQHFRTREIPTEAFRLIQAPIFKIYTDGYIGDSDDRRAITNPLLRELEFYRIVPPYDAFQRISQYLSNELAHQPETGDVPDKYKIGQHGYDKWSFRKQPADLERIK